jgi:hypothetical protein
MLSDKVKKIIEKFREIKNSRNTVKEKPKTETK